MKIEWDYICICALEILLNDDTHTAMVVCVFGCSYPTEDINLRDRAMSDNCLPSI